MDALSKAIAMIMAAVLLTLFPLQYVLEHQLLLSVNYAEEKVEQFSREVREKGCIDINMYETFQKDLNKTGLRFDIEIEHAVPKEGTDSVSINEFPGMLVVSSNLTSLPDCFTVNTEQKAADFSQITLFATHVHTADCYAGHNHTASSCSYHTHSGSSTTGGGCFGGANYIYHAHTSSCYHTHTSIYGSCYSSSYCGGSAKYNGSDQGNYGSTICPKCGTDVADGYVERYVCSICGASMGAIYHNLTTYHCGVKLHNGTGTTNTVKSSCTASVYKLTCNIQTGTPVCGKTTDSIDGISSYYINCGKYEGWQCGLSNDSNPICNTVVAGIAATNPTQSVDKGGSIITTATATYLDGHTGTVSCTSNFNTNLIGTQNVTLTYSGLVGNARTTGTRTCTLTVTVRDPKKPVSLSVTPSSSSVYNGNEPTYTVIVTYSDNSTKTLTSAQYTKTGWSTGPGTKTVTFSYTEGSTTVTKSITITVLPNVSGLSVTPSSTSVYNGTEPTYTVVITYENNATKTLTASQYTKTGWTTGPGIKTVTFSYTEGSKTVTKTITITVLPNVSSLSVTPSSTSVYNGTEPTYTVVVTYENNSTKNLTAAQYTKSGWTSGAGTKTVTFSYTENNKTLTKSVSITVRPNLTSIIAAPAVQTIERYTNPALTVTAKYENSTTANVTGYTISGMNNTLIGDQNVTVSYTENGITKTAAVKVTITPMRRTCPKCGTVYYLDSNNFDQGCPVCKVTVVSISVAPETVYVQKNAGLPVTVTATYSDGHTDAVTGWTSNYNSSQLGFQMVTISYVGRTALVRVNVLLTKTCAICSTEYCLNNDGSDPGCPVCSVNVMSISASPASQTVNQGTALNLTVTARFLDGHSTAVTGWTSNFSSQKPGLQTVTVYYRNKTCTVNVTVNSEYQTICSICRNIYNFRDYPFGCPLCANTLISISAVLKNGGTRTPFGQPLDLSVVLTYRDNHKAQAFGGWNDNFNPFTLGVQTVTIRFTDTYGNTVSCSLTVEIVNRGDAATCPNGHVYYPEESGGECPYCALINGKEAEGLYICTFTDEILDKLYTDGIYHLQQGDYVTVKVIFDVKGSIYSFSLFGRKEDKKDITFGGEVA